MTHATHLGVVHHEAGSRNTRMKVLVLTLKKCPAHWGSSCERAVSTPLKGMCKERRGLGPGAQPDDSMLWKKALVRRQGEWRRAAGSPRGGPLTQRQLR